MSFNKIIIFTAFFPYGHSESFLFNEIKYVSNYYSIEIYPLLRDKKGTIRNLPNNIIVHKPLLHRSILIRLIQGIFNFSPISFYIKDLINLFKYSKKPMNSLIEWVINLISFRRVYSKIINDPEFNSQDCLLYFYWFTLPLEPFSNKLNKILVRVHGGEIDFKRHNGYITVFKEKINCSNNISFIPISRSCSKLLYKFNQNLNLHISRIGVFDNGLSPNYKDPDITTIVSCSNLIPLKRVHLIVEALRHIKLSKVHWIHFGDGPLMSIIKNISTTLSPNIYVNLKGHVSNNELICFYKKTPIDLFINVSETEGVPVSIMEALSFGIPCFATNVGGTREIVNDNVGKLVNQDFNISELVFFIDNIKSNNEKYNYSVNARLMWDKLCNAEKNFKDLKLIIDELFENNKIIR